MRRPSSSPRTSASRTRTDRERPTVSSHDSNARLAELIRAGLQRADQLGRTRVPLKLFPAEDQEELLTLLHAYLWDTAAPYDDEWHRSPGNIITLWAELLEIGSKTRHRLIPLRTDLVKLLTERGLGYRTHPRSVPVLVREYSGPIETPVHPGDARETSSTIAVGGWGAGFGDADTNRQVELAAEKVVRKQPRGTSEGNHRWARGHQGRVVSKRPVAHRHLDRCPRTGGGHRHGSVWTAPGRPPRATAPDGHHGPVVRRHQSRALDRSGQSCRSVEVQPPGDSRDDRRRCRRCQAWPGDRGTPMAQRPDCVDATSYPDRTSRGGGRHHRPRDTPARARGPPAQALLRPRRRSRVVTR